MAQSKWSTLQGWESCLRCSCFGFCHHIFPSNHHDLHSLLMVKFLIKQDAKCFIVIILIKPWSRGQDKNQQNFLVSELGQEIPNFQEHLHHLLHHYRCVSYRLWFLQSCCCIHVPLNLFSPITSIAESFVILIIYPAGFRTWILIKKKISLN